MVARTLNSFLLLIGVSFVFCAAAEVEPVRPPVATATPMAASARIEHVHWNAVIEGVTAAVVAAVLLAVFAMSRARLKNVWLKHRIHQEARKIGFGHERRGITAGISNHTGRDLIVREVAVLTDQMELLMTATGDTTSDIEEKRPKLSREQLERLRRGEAVAVGPLRLESRAWQIRPTLAGFATIAPFTQQTFLLASSLIAAMKGTPTSIRIVFEYRAWTGDVKILKTRVPVPSELPKLLELTWL